jgi:hypothetical protein
MPAWADMISQRLMGRQGPLQVMPTSDARCSSPASRAKGAGGKCNHDKKRAERGEFGNVAHGMGGGMHFGLLDH